MANDNERRGTISVSRLRASELRSVAELEALCFSEPWSEESLKLLLGKNGAGFVARDSDGGLVGYVGLVNVLDEGQITNVATHPDHRRKGVATALLKALVDFCAEREIRYLSLEVRVSNEGAIALYEGFGFKNMGRRRNFYRSPTEDAFVMTAELD